MDCYGRARKIVPARFRTGLAGRELESLARFGPPKIVGMRRATSRFPLI